jgi:hypothetical protein
MKPRTGCLQVAHGAAGRKPRRRHPGKSRNPDRCDASLGSAACQPIPAIAVQQRTWIPAFAGMTAVLLRPALRWSPAAFGHRCSTVQFLSSCSPCFARPATHETVSQFLSRARPIAPRPAASNRHGLADRRFAAGTKRGGPADQENTAARQHRPIPRRHTGVDDDAGPPPVRAGRCRRRTCRHPAASAGGPATKPAQALRSRYNAAGRRRARSSRSRPAPGSAATWPWTHAKAGLHTKRGAGLVAGWKPGFQPRGQPAGCEEHRGRAGRRCGPRRAAQACGL